MRVRNFLLGLTVLLSCAVMAQEKGDFSGFAGATYPVADGADIGINAGVEYMFADNMSAAPSFSYYFAPSGVTNYTINADARYYFGDSDSLRYYGLIGVAFSTVKLEVTGFGSVSASTTGVNAGGGLLYAMSDAFEVIAQVKYGSAGSTGAVEPMVGVSFKF